MSAYEYELPKGLVAQEPTEKRDESRLMVLSRRSGKIMHKRFSDMTEFLNPGDCLVMNRTKVVPARLFGRKATGGRVEVLFLNGFGIELPKVVALLKPFLKTGTRITFPGGLTACVEAKTALGETVLELSGADLGSVLETHGDMPLPPYIKRGAGSKPGLKSLDRERYQTVYATQEGSIAAPTAGLHFTQGMISDIKAKGVEVAEVVLHVGWGTFRPLVSKKVADHKMLSEYYEISGDSADKINGARKRGRRVIAVGTTSVRALESAVEAGRVTPQKNNTSLFIHPGQKFRVIDSMITNFHLPRSTPLLMVCAFAGRNRIFAAYREAIEAKYRFFSYGDAMLIL
ncbi:MAG: tRNA preQ1(34) S-adenosylmethionine ribosyltransferase-isomerase QueA [Endomicrobiales bacterium]|nr:tRNA preQ1(34) S-adenosylmethionine ribosyltransferase-isomerase QueA [Endomicrobiales bacterium]